MVNESIDGYNLLEKEVTWKKLGVLFNHAGAVGIKGKIIYLRFTLPENIGENVKNFLGVGSISRGRDYDIGRVVLELNSRMDVLDFIINVQPYADYRKEVIEYLMLNYDFKDNLNENFNKEEFEMLKRRTESKITITWNNEELKQKLLARKELLEKLKNKLDKGKELTLEEDRQVESKQLEGGEQ